MPDPRAYLRLVLIGALIGLPAGDPRGSATLLLTALLAGRPGLDAIPAAVLAIAAAWLTATALERPAPAA